MSGDLPAAAAGAKPLNGEYRPPGWPGWPTGEAWGPPGAADAEGETNGL